MGCRLFFWTTANVRRRDGNFLMLPSVSDRQNQVSGTADGRLSALPLAVTAACTLVLVIATCGIAWYLSVASAPSGGSISAALPAIATASLPPALDPPAPLQGAQTVTPREALGIASTAWTTFEDALARNDAAVLAASTLPGGLQKAVRACAVTSTCGQQGSDATVGDLAVVVPRETSYPSYFLGEFETWTRSGEPWLGFGILVRTSPAEPWRFGMVSGTTYGHAAKGVDPIPFLPFTGTTARSTVTGDGTYNLPAAAPLTQEPSVAALSTIASYWQQAKDDGHDPRDPAVDASGSAAAIGARLAGSPQGATVNGMTTRYSFRADASQGLWTFFGDGQIVCGSIVDAATTTGSGFAPLLQGSNRAAWSAFIPQGGYLSVTQDVAHAVCVVPEPGPTLDAIGETTWIVGGSARR